MRPGRLELPAS